MSFKKNLSESSESESDPRRTIMLHNALVFLIVAIIAGILGFGFISGLAATIAKVCFFIFIVFAILSFVKKST